SGSHSATRFTSPLESIPLMSPRPCPPQPTTARFSLPLAAVDAALPPTASGPAKPAAAIPDADVLRNVRRENPVLRCFIVRNLPFDPGTAPESVCPRIIL